MLPEGGDKPELEYLSVGIWKKSLKQEMRQYYFFSIRSSLVTLSE